MSGDFLKIPFDLVLLSIMTMYLCGILKMYPYRFILCFLLLRIHVFCHVWKIVSLWVSSYVIFILTRNLRLSPLSSWVACHMTCLHLRSIQFCHSSCIWSAVKGIPCFSFQLCFSFLKVLVASCLNMAGHSW